MYPTPPKNRVPNLPAKSFKMNFSTCKPIFLRLDRETIYKILLPCKFSAKTVCGASQTSKIQLFSRFFTHFRDPNFLLYCQNLYQSHTSHSRLSSLSIGLLYLQHPPPILALQNFFEIFLRYSQSLYKTHIRETLFSPFPIGNFQLNFDITTGHGTPRVNESTLYHFYRTSTRFFKKLSR